MKENPMNLTVREIQVLRKLVEKMPHKVAARDLGLTRANVCCVSTRLRMKGFDCSKEAGRQAGKAYLAALNAPAEEKRVPGLTDHQLAILKKYAAGKNYEMIAWEISRERGKPVKPATVMQAISQTAQAIGAIYRGDPTRRRKLVAQWLDENLKYYTAPEVATLPDMDPANY